MDKRLVAYMKAVNKIDDYFEYRCESKKDQQEVHKVLKELLGELQECRTVNIGETK